MQTAPLEDEISKLGRKLRLKNQLLSMLLTEVVRKNGPALPVSDEGARFVPIAYDLKPNAVGTIFSFAGLSQEGSFAEFEFRKTLTDTPYSVVYVKDNEQTWYQKGLKGLGDTRNNAFTAFASLDLNLPRPWIFIGNSAGGYAAIFAGWAAQADRVVAFAPQTMINARIFRHYSGETPHARGFDLKDPQNDLRNVLPYYQPVPTKIVYPQQNRRDTNQAEHLYALPGIDMMPLDIRSHHVAAHLRGEGRLIETILES